MQNLIKNILTDIKVELSQEFGKNFERKAFFSDKWKKRGAKKSKQNTQ